MKTIKIFVVVAVILSSFPVFAQQAGVLDSDGFFAPTPMGAGGVSCSTSMAGARMTKGLAGGGGSGLVGGTSPLAGRYVRSAANRDFHS